MAVTTETEPKLQPVVRDGKVVPGLFIFDHLERNTDAVREKLIFDLKQLVEQRARKVALPK